MGGWGASALHFPAPTDALVKFAVPHIVGGRLSLRVTFAGQPTEFKAPVTDNGGAGYGRAQRVAVSRRRAQL